MQFTPTTLSAGEEALRAEVRKFLADELPRGTYRPGLGMSGAHDPAFSRRLGERGWLGMAIPTSEGGHGRTAVDRFVVIEELLAAGAPIGAHWVSDRQTGPGILKFGTEAQRRRFLPGIVAGEVYFSIGMSEPDAGSDLASVRTTATRGQDGWLLNGTKVWTSGAHVNHYFVVLCRTGQSEDRHEGLSQLIVDLHSPGVEVRPITFLDGTHHFNEVVLQDVFVPDDMVLGEIGLGWQQVTSELAYERAGPDRFMSVHQVLEAFLRERAGTTPEPPVAEAVGRLVARMWAVRQLSLSVSRTIDEGGAPAVEAALVKDLGTTFEQEAVEVLRTLADTELDLGSPSLFESLLAQSTVVAPSYTLRGGTNEVLRSVASKGLRPQGGRAPTGDGLLQETVERMLTEKSTPEAVRAAERDGWAPELWRALADAGLPWVGVPEEAGGSGGTLADACAVLRLAGYYAAPVPLAETGVLGGWLLARAGLPLPDGPVTVAPGVAGDRLDLRRDGDGWRADGVLRRVPWAGRADRVVALATGADGRWVVALPAGAGRVEPGRNMAGEPRDTVVLEGAALGQADMAAAPDDVDGDALRLRGALARAVQMAGAAQAAVDLSVAYAGERVQFGRPIGRFQAVQAHLVRAAAEAALAGMAAAVAVQALPSARASFEVAAAKVVTGRAARTVAAAAHQVHGAIGMTQEHELHLRTRRLWSWADELGSEAWWATRLGREVAAAGADELWPLISSGPEGR